MKEVSLPMTLKQINRIAQVKMGLYYVIKLIQEMRQIKMN